MKKTLRLIITLECNLTCEYCCNKLPEVNSKFIKKKLDEIDFEQYEAVCITGGEPLLRPLLIRKLYDIIPCWTPFYLYTNGLLLTIDNASWFDGINVGIHYKNQIKELLEKDSKFLSYRNLRLYVQDINKEDWVPNIPDKYVKTWTMNDCFNNVNTEDWVLLID